MDSKAKARCLLESSIVSAIRTISSDKRSPALTESRWVWRLAAAYHLCHPTPRLMAEAAQRFASLGRCKEARWAQRKACEERNHDLVALHDIQSLGYDAEQVVKALFPPPAASLVNYFTHSVQVSDPITCIGYCFCMERLAVSIEEDYIHKVKAQLPPGATTNCLRIHSNAGSDANHVEETVALVAELVPEEQQQVEAACYQTALLCFSPPRCSYISEQELQNVLKPLKLANKRRQTDDLLPTYRVDEPKQIT